MQIFWFIPTHGDGRYLGTSFGGRAMNLSYLQQMAQAVDRLGYIGALLPTGRSCEDAWVAELLFPHLPLESLPNLEGQVMMGPFGEILANETLPTTKTDLKTRLETQLTVD
jgi:hypothetical protein